MSGRTASDWQRMNNPVIAEFRANGGKVKGRQWPVLLLTTTGAKSGQPRVTPLNYTTDGERLVVIASKGGSPTHPDWYRNLVANPEVTIELGGRRSGRAPRPPRSRSGRGCSTSRRRSSPSSTGTASG
jgi:deazaflavin-dependent oxidoreductase (nitroreductase family)